LVAAYSNDSDRDILVGEIRMLNWILDGAYYETCMFTLEEEQETDA
jgi:hypothetical protein